MRKVIDCPGSGMRIKLSKYDVEHFDRIECPVCNREVPFEVPFDEVKSTNKVYVRKHTVFEDSLRASEPARKSSSVLNPMSASDAKTLDKMFSSMKPGDGKKIQNSKTYMPLSLDRLSDNSFAMAHNYVQEGDLIPDPDMELYRDKNGNWYPAAIQMAVGTYTRAIYLDEDGENIEKYSPRAYAELRSFLIGWLKNIRIQQGIK
jgi:hypothetical protein